MYEKSSDQGYSRSFYVKNTEKRSKYDKFKPNYFLTDHPQVLARFDLASVGVKYTPKFSKYLDFTAELTPGLQAKSTSVGCNFGPNGPKSNNQLKNAQNAMKTKINYRIV